MYGECAGAEEESFWHAYIVFCGLQACRRMCKQVMRRQSTRPGLFDARSREERLALIRRLYRSISAVWVQGLRTRHVHRECSTGNCSRPHGSDLLTSKRRQIFRQRLLRFVFGTVWSRKCCCLLRLICRRHSGNRSCRGLSQNKASPVISSPRLEFHLSC